MRPEAVGFYSPQMMRRAIVLCSLNVMRRKSKNVKLKEAIHSSKGAHFNRRR